MSQVSKYLDQTKSLLKRNYGSMPEYHQAVSDVAEDVVPFIVENYDEPERQFRIFTYLMEPDRFINFRVNWQDDNNQRRSNRGMRVQFNNSLGPYKGGLRLEGNVNAGVLHFLGFEQTFKNSLTGLPMGGAKGGADFDPRDKSDGEIERFCRAFMAQLSRYIGPDRDIPAGDIGVGTTQIAVMFDEYKSLTGTFSGIVTGKDPVFGGSCFREEATGYGCVYFADDVLQQHNKKLAGKRCVISGAGNVSLHTAEKLIELDAEVISLSDRGGYVHFENGLERQNLEDIKMHKKARGNLQTLAKKTGWTFQEGKKPWALDAELAFACATQNEVAKEDAEELVSNGCKFLFEGANMPCTADATRHLRNEGVIIGPAKAANAGGVAVSGLEIAQNKSGNYLSANKVDEELRAIMERIHDACVEHGKEDNADKVDYKKGANLAGFETLSRATDLFGSY